MNSRVPSPSDYDGIYRRKEHFSILDEIEAGVVGDPDITKLKCTGFLGPGDRNRYRDLLSRSMARGHRATLLDLGCGMGLFGAWMAEQLGADLIGIDFSPVAISLARRFASQVEITRKTFMVGSFDSIRLDDCSVAATFSLDALYLSEDPVVALREVHRVMMPGSPLLFTYFVEPQVKHDWALLARNTGFDNVSVTDVTRVWREHMQKKHLRRWARRQEIRKKLGPGADSELSVTTSMLGLNGKPAFIESAFRYLLAAIRQ